MTLSSLSMKIVVFFVAKYITEHFIDETQKDYGRTFFTGTVPVKPVIRHPTQYRHSLPVS